MKICTCNNCGNIYDDPNPGDKSIEYVELCLDKLILIHDEDSQDQVFFWGCPECETDSYLQDNINLNALNEETKRELNKLITFEL